MVAILPVGILTLFSQAQIGEILDMESISFNKNLATQCFTRRKSQLPQPLMVYLNGQKNHVKHPFPRSVWNA